MLSLRSQLRFLVSPILLAPLSLAQTASPSAVQTPTPQTTPQTAPPPSAPADLPDGPEAASQTRPPVTPTGPTALIDTSLGRLTCKLYDKQAPVTVANFIGLATGTKDWVDPKTLKKVHGQPFYSGTTFHRVIPNFMIQGGDRAGDGTGDPGYYFEDEIDPSLTFNVPGRLAMANSGPSTNGSQFFITEAPVEELNGKHTILGQCDAQTVSRVATIARVDRNANDKPTTPVVINKITIVPDGQPIPPDATPKPAVAAPASETIPSAH